MVNKTIIIYHGTSAKAAKKILEEGFKTDLNYNWGIRSKKGFVYFSTAYAPFYAMNVTDDDELAIVKVEIETRDLYPEDDFIMYALGKPKYTQEELDKIKLRDYKRYWKVSLEYMGNAAARPWAPKVLGIKTFSRKGLIMKCDPVISPTNFKIMGNYYEKMTEHLFETGDINTFPGLTEFLVGKEGIKVLQNATN